MDYMSKDVLVDVVFGKYIDDKKFKDRENRSFLSWLLANDEYDFDLSLKVAENIALAISNGSNSVLEDINSGGYDDKNRSFMFYLLTNPSEEMFRIVVNGLNNWLFKSGNNLFKIYNVKGTDFNLTLGSIILARYEILKANNIIPSTYNEYVEDIKNDDKIINKIYFINRVEVISYSDLGKDIFMEIANDLSKHFDERIKKMPKNRVKLIAIEPAQLAIKY